MARVRTIPTETLVDERAYRQRRLQPGVARTAVELEEERARIPHPYANSKQFFTAAAQKFDYDDDQIKYLVEPTNVLEVNFRVEPENSEEAKRLARVVGREFTGWRIRFNPTGEPAKGGIRVTAPLDRDDILSLSEEMDGKLKVMGLTFGGGKGGFECKDWKELNKEEKYALMRAFIRGVHRELGPVIDVPAGDVGTTDSQMMDAIADESRKILQDYAKAALKGADVWRAGVRFQARGADEFIERNYGVKVKGDRKLLQRIAEEDRFAYFIAAPIVTAKTPPKGGLKIRDEATGRGTAICVMEAAKESYLRGTWTLSDEVTAAERGKIEESREFIARNTWELSTDEERARMDELYGILLKGKRVAVEGFGNAGQWAAVHLERMGARIIAVSDTSGVAVMEGGIPLAQMLAHKKADKPVTEFAGIRVIPPEQGRDIFKLDADIFIPAALAGSIREDGARALIETAARRKSDVIISEAANNPTTPEANRLFEQAQEGKPAVRRVPDILANALGVTTSIAECAYNYLGIKRAGIPLTAEYEAHIERTLSNLDSSRQILSVATPEITYEQWGRILDDRMRWSYNGARRMATEKGVDLAMGTWLTAVDRIVKGVPGG